MPFKFRAKVTPGAKREAIVFRDGMIKAYISASPSKGKANKRLRELFSDLLNVKKGNVEIISGLASNRKVISISGMKEEDFWKIIKDLG